MQEKEGALDTQKSVENTQIEKWIHNWINDTCSESKTSRWFQAKNTSDTIALVKGMKLAPCDS